MKTIKELKNEVEYLQDELDNECLTISSNVVGSEEYNFARAAVHVLETDIYLLQCEIDHREMSNDS